MKEYQENLDNLQLFFSNSDKPEDKQELAKGYSYVGKVLVSLGKNEDAKPYFSSAIKLLEEAGNDPVGLEELRKLSS